MDEHEVMVEAVAEAIRRQKAGKITLPKRAYDIPERMTLPKRAFDIPRDCYVNPRPMIRWARTEEFLNALDAQVRHSPAEGVPLKDACQLMRRFGGTLKVNSLQILLERTRSIHALTVYKGHVRLSTKELLERLANERVA